MVISAFVFLAVAITTAIVGIAAPWDQGIPEIMFWFTAVSLALTLGFVLTHIGRVDEAL